MYLKLLDFIVMHAAKEVDLFQEGLYLVLVVDTIERFLVEVLKGLDTTATWFSFYGE